MHCHCISIFHYTITGPGSSIKLPSPHPRLISYTMPFKLGCCLTWKKQQDHGFSIKRPSPKILEESSLQLCNPTLFQDIIWKSNESRQESPWSRSRSCSDSSITRWFTIINFYKTLRIILNRNKTIHTIIIFRWINIKSFLQEYFLNFIQIHEINKLHKYSYHMKKGPLRYGK